MERLDRIYLLHNVLSTAHHPVPGAQLQERMECSRATLHRTIEHMRIYLHAPIEYDRERNGYYYDHSSDHPYELPGMWFNASELYGLLASYQLLSATQPGLLDGHIAPLRKRIQQILAHKHLRWTDVARRVRILPMAARAPENPYFVTIADALMQRHRLHIEYHGRASGGISERDISPQRLVHYRDNWYLDAWCHVKQALRSFSVDRIRRAKKLAENAREIADEVLDDYFATGYGIFAGRPADTAVLHFSPERARWVADERWHPQQESTVLADGTYELRIPYSDPRELMMDILKYGPDVEVAAPASLREAVASRVRETAARYG